MTKTRMVILIAVIFLLANLATFLFAKSYIQNKMKVVEKIAQRKDSLDRIPSTDKYTSKEITPAGKKAMNAGYLRSFDDSSRLAANERGTAAKSEAVQSKDASYVKASIKPVDESATTSGAVVLDDDVLDDDVQTQASHTDHTDTDTSSAGPTYTPPDEMPPPRLPNLGYDYEGDEDSGSVSDVALPKLPD